ncbi:MAG TPA: hypothetical protein VND92_01725, partial [Vicinamibacterales bacterium]|nr:hypothetical protein [Vicinamibacterales bacterium]
MLGTAKAADSDASVLAIVIPLLAARLAAWLLGWRRSAALAVGPRAAAPPPWRAAGCPSRSDRR